MINSHLTYAVLSVWNWSLLQFCLAIGASHKSRKTFGYSKLSNPARIITVVYLTLGPQVSADKLAEVQWEADKVPKRRKM